MSTIPPTPTPPPPDKDPPSQTSSSSPTPTPQPPPPQRTPSEIPPSHTPPTSHSLSTAETPAQQQPPPRPSPLRQNTADSQQPQAGAPSLTLPSTSTVTTPAPLSTSRPPPFHPFFTLINDPGSGTTHHPRQMHYLFSDDDESEMLTSACLRSLHATTTTSPSTSQTSTSQKLPSSFTSSSSSTAAATRREAPAPAPAREERVIVVDMNPAGDAISQIHSLSANWQVLSASLEKAPTWAAGGDEEEEVVDREVGGGGLMLRIEGVGVGVGVDGKGDGGMMRSGSAVVGEDEMQGLLEGFDRKMGMLRKIVGAGEQFMAARAEKGENEERGREKEEETGKEE